MIVVDTNVLAYLLVPGRYTEAAEQLLLSDPVWAAPLLWRSELRNVLATYVRAKHMELSDAVALHRRASDSSSSRGPRGSRLWTAGRPAGWTVLLAKT